MSRDQRPGQVRIFADPKESAERSRRRDDDKAVRKPASKSISATQPARRRSIIPILLFVIGFAAGGIIVAARNFIGGPVL